MNKEEIISLIEAKKFSNISTDYLKSLLRSCISVSTHRVKETIVGQSKIGGLPDLPDGLAWPNTDGESLTFVAQFRLSEINPFDESGLLPPAGMLYFFYDTDPYRGHHKVIYHPLEVTQLVRQSFPVGLPKDKRYRVCAVTFHNEYSLPNYESIFFPLDSSTETYWEDQEQYFDLLHQITPTLRHQLLGHAAALQMGLENDETEKLLFQVNEDFNAQLAWPAAGMIYYWIAESALSSGNFDDTWAILQTT